MKRPTLRHRLEYLGFRAVVRLVGTLPEVPALLLGEGLGWLAGSVFRVRRGVVDGNLTRAFPQRPRRERDRIARSCYRHLGREAITMLRMAGLPSERIRERTELVGFAAVQEALARGRGVVVVTGHLGNWEIGGAALAARGVPVDAVAQVQRNPLFDRDLVAVRERLGMRVIPRSEAVRRGFRGLREGRLLALVGDQNVREGGVFVDFFGTPASTARGAAVFALRAGAPLFVAVALRCPGRRGWYRVHFESVPVVSTGDLEADVTAVTRSLTRALEGYVRQAPEQYFWHHRRWRTAEPSPLPDVEGGP